MIYKKLLGIYINESGIQYANHYKLFPGLLPGKRGLFKKDAGSHVSLGKLLDYLKPSSKRRIYLALPRECFFARRIQFPDLPLDDVRDSVVNSLDIYSHLPLEEIYYDILFKKIKGKGVNALLYYAPRKKLDIYINQIRESGHIRSLEAIIPFSYGAGPWVWGNSSASKNALVIRYKDATELAIYEGNTCIDTFFANASANEDTQNKEIGDKVIRDIMADHELPPESVRQVNDRVLEAGDSGDGNMGAAAIAPLFGSIQPVSVDENLPRIKLFKPYRVLLPLFILLVSVMAYLTVDIREKNAARQAELAEVKKAVTAVNKEIDPILEAKEALNKAAAYKGDVEDFVSTKPPLFSYINELALIVPEDTWFAHLSYKPGIISMQGEGGDVLRVVEALRASGKYKEVKQKGSVSRTKEGKDKFMIDLILKEPKDIIEGKTDR